VTQKTAWRETSRLRVYDGYRKIDVVEYEQPDGRIQPLDMLISPDAVCTLALTVDGRVILAEQYRPGPGAYLLELPGGYIDAGEDPAAAGARELVEETGYAGDIKLVSQTYLEGNSTRRRYCCVATNCRLVADQSFDDGEFVELRLMSVAEFRQLLQSGQMTDVDMGYLGLDYLGLL
jgi:ADP-ribose pyrophosphatase